MKICDFGWSVNQEQDSRTTFCGTYEYMAPEIVSNKAYDKKVDVWSLGILLYELLHGYSPFKGEQTMQVLTNIKLSKISFGRFVSWEAKDLIKKILRKEPKERIEIGEILSHPFVLKYGVQEESCRRAQETDRRNKHIEDRARIEQERENKENQKNLYEIYKSNKKNTEKMSEKKNKIKHSRSYRQLYAKEENSSYFVKSSKKKKPSRTDFDFYTEKLKSESVEEEFPHHHMQSLQNLQELAKNALTTRPETQNTPRTYKKLKKEYQSTNSNFYRKNQKENLNFITEHNTSLEKVPDSAQPSLNETSRYLQVNGDYNMPNVNNTHKIFEEIISRGQKIGEETQMTERAQTSRPESLSLQRRPQVVLTSRVETQKPQNNQRLFLTSQKSQTELQTQHQPRLKTVRSENFWPDSCEALQSSANPKKNQNNENQRENYPQRVHQQNLGNLGLGNRYEDPKTDRREVSAAKNTPTSNFSVKHNIPLQTNENFENQASTKRKNKLSHLLNDLHTLASNSKPNFAPKPSIQPVYSSQARNEYSFQRPNQINPQTDRDHHQQSLNGARRPPRPVQNRQVVHPVNFGSYFAPSMPRREMYTANQPRSRNVSVESRVGDYELGAGGSQHRQVRDSNPFRTNLVEPGQFNTFVQQRGQISGQDAIYSYQPNQRTENSFNYSTPVRVRLSRRQLSFHAIPNPPQDNNHARTRFSPVRKVIKGPQMIASGQKRAYTPIFDRELQNERVYQNYGANATFNEYSRAQRESGLSLGHRRVREDSLGYYGERRVTGRSFSIQNHHWENYQ